MDTTSALVIVILAVIALVIYQEVAKNKAQFENNEHQKELFKGFLDGFRAGLDNENVNNRIYVDDILKRVGFTASEMTTEARIEEIVDERLQEDDEIPPVVLDHEVDFDAAERALEENNGLEAEWVDPNSPNDLRTNTLLPLDPKSPAILRPLTE